MERVAVIGNSGGGKSGLARQLASRLDLTYVEVDVLLWRRAAGGRRRPRNTTPRMRGASPKAAG